MEDMKELIKQKVRDEIKFQVNRSQEEPDPIDHVADNKEDQ